MQILADFLPVIAFFAVYKFYGIYAATAVLIAVTLVQVVWTRLRGGEVRRMQLVTAGLVLVFGGATILLQDDWFILVKPSVAYALFALAFALSGPFTGQPLVQRLLGHTVAMEATHWRRLNRAWVIFFLALAAANLYVAFNFSQDTWVNFKLFGLLGLTLVFMFVQALWMSQHGEFQEAPGEEEPDERDGD